MHEVLVNRLGGLSLPRKSVVRLTDRPDMTLDVYRGRKTTMQHATFLSGALKFHFGILNVKVRILSVTNCHGTLCTFPNEIKYPSFKLT